MAKLAAYLLQADLIGAEFKDPGSAPGQPLHEELYTKLITAGVYSSQGREHMIATVGTPPVYCCGWW